jgi:hypothetical protein
VEVTTEAAMAEVWQARAKAAADVESAAVTMSHLQRELAEAMAELAAARVVMAAVARADLAAAAPTAVIHTVGDEEDDNMGFLPAKRM